MRKCKQGFTLLEVMVAIAILGLGLTAILSAQAGTFSMSAQARNLSMATTLARCKMGEIEEQLKKDGFQELEVNESGSCCEDDSTPNIECAWKVEKVELPQPNYGALDINSGLDFNSGSGGIPGMPPGTNSSSSGSGGDMPDVGGMLQMIAQAAYPDLKSIYEGSTRKVTLTVTWKQGSKDYSFAVEQWISRPQLPVQDTQRD
jgi:general secretion pathway protein I